MTRTTTAIVIFIAALPCAAIAANWAYVAKANKLTDERTVAATAVSDNAFNFSFPYRGSNRARIIARNNGSKGLDVIFAIERGQIICYECKVMVRFNDETPETFYGERSTDGDPTVLFLESGERFIESASKAKRIRVEFTAYHDGVHVADFKFSKGLALPQPAKQIAPETEPQTPAEPEIFLTCREITDPGKAAECVRQVKGCMSFIKTDADRKSCADLAADLVGKK